MRLRPLSPAAALLGLALPALGGACGRPMPSAVLPDAVIAVVALESGELVSILVELPRPGVDPIVRLADGAVAMDRGWGRALVLDGQLEGGTTLSLLDLGSDASRPVELESAFSVRRLGPEGVLLRTAEGLLLVPARPDLPATLVGQDPGPAGSADHPGPASGFHLRLHDGRVEISLPRAEDAPWTGILHDVDHLIGSWWIVSERLAPWQRRILDDRFKQVDMITPGAGTARADGDLGEWRGQRALRVDGPAQIVQGQRGWRGERDGGMGIAARAGAEGGAVLAVRVRDDAVVPELDRLVLRQGTLEIQVPLDGVRGELQGEGWRAVRTRRRGGDQAVELHLDRLDPHAMVVQLLDVDPDEPATLLATAPYPAMLARGALTLIPDGPSRPAPQ